MPTFVETGIGMRNLKVRLLENGKDE